MPRHTAAAPLDGPLKEGVSQHILVLAVASAWDCWEGMMCLEIPRLVSNMAWRCLGLEEALG